MIKDVLNIALIQLDSTTNEDENLITIEKMVKEASNKAKLIILPEHANGVWKDNRSYAQKIPGKTSDIYASLAKKYNIYLHCGSMAESGPNGKPYNTSVLYSPEGELLAKYSKLHLFDVELPDGTGCKESDDTSAGDEIVVAETDICNMGLSICYDIRFPELFRKMALSNADILVVSANFTAPTGRDHWKVLLRSRAIENGCYVVAVNQCGNKPQFEAYGHTMLIDPWGNILGELDDKPGILYGSITNEVVTNIRNKIPSLLNRRNDLY